MEISSNYNEEANLLSTDSKFRSYASSMDKALKAFEGSGEWADLINSLAKMQKVVFSDSVSVHQSGQESECVYLFLGAPKLFRKIYYHTEKIFGCQEACSSPTPCFAVRRASQGSGNIPYNFRCNR